MRSLTVGLHVLRGTIVTTTLAMLNLKISCDVTTPFGCCLVVSITVAGGTIISSALFFLRMLPYAAPSHDCRVRCIPANNPIACQELKTHQHTLRPTPGFLHLPRSRNCTERYTRSQKLHADFATLVCMAMSFIQLLNKAGENPTTFTD
jgi:hypothetical protein